MPSNLLNTDVGFPRLEDYDTNEEKFAAILDYLYMLREQLRYSMGNLDSSNFNETGLSEISSMITEPVYIALQDQEGRYTAALQVTAEGIYSKISDTEQGFTSQLSQTAEALNARCDSIDGKYTTVTQTVNGLTTTIGTVDGKVTKISQTVNGLTVSDENGTTLIDGGKIYTTNLYVEAAHITGMLTASQINATGLKVDAADITGQLTASQISATGLKAGTLVGQYAYLQDKSETTQGYIAITPASSADEAVQLYSYGGLRLSAGGGDLYAKGSGGAYVQLHSKVILGGGNTRPNDNNVYSCGESSWAWSAVYAQTDTIQSSDRNAKHDIEALPDKYLAMLRDLQPCRFKYNTNTSDRFHVGYIAQDVEGTMEKHGIDPQEFGGFCKDRDADGNDIYMLRYGEFIAIHTAAIQDIYKRLEQLEESA